MRITSALCAVVLMLTLTSMNSSIAGIRKVLVEVFSSTTDSNSFQPANYYFNQWLPFYPSASKVVTISYHTWYPMLGDLFYLANPNKVRRRAEYYSQPTMPAARVNGAIDGTNDPHLWAILVDSLAQTNSPLSLSMFGHGGQTGVQLNATITADSVVNSSNWKLFFVVIESDLFQPQNSSGGFVPFLHSFVFREIYPDSVGIPITISQGQTVNKFQFVTIRSSWQFQACKFIAFIQDSVTRAIQNAEMIGRERIVSVGGDEKGIRGTFALFQNYPNPFNPETKIGFRIREAAVVTLKVFDVLGKEVATLVNEGMRPGNYERTFDGNKLASGVYIYRLETGGFVQSKKLLLVK